MTSLFEEVPVSIDGDIPTTRVEVKVNGERRAAEIEPRLLLAHLLRNGFKLTGTHTGCDTTNCGACTVLLDGEPVKSCTVFAVQANGHEVTTVEGLASSEQLHPVQEGFKDEHGLQCGFCTPGMMLSAVALLNENDNPTEDEVRWALSGNLCRCTGYQPRIWPLRNRPRPHRRVCPARCRHVGRLRTAPHHRIAAAPVSDAGVSRCR